jgi:hypothetical protein
MLPCLLKNKVVYFLTHLVEALTVRSIKDLGVGCAIIPEMGSAVQILKCD